MYKVQDAWGWPAFVYFMLLVVFGMWIMANLLIAVLGDSYTGMYEQLMVDRKRRAQARGSLEFEEPDEGRQAEAGGKRLGGAAACGGPRPAVYRRARGPDSHAVVTSTLWNTFFIAVIAANTVVVALWTPYNGPELAQAIVGLNWTFSALYAIEMAVLLRAHGTWTYLATPPTASTRRSSCSPSSSSSSSACPSSTPPFSLRSARSAPFAS